MCVCFLRVCEHKHTIRIGSPVLFVRDEQIRPDRVRAVIVESYLSLVCLGKGVRHGTSVLLLSAAWAGSIG